METTLTLIGTVFTFIFLVVVQWTFKRYKSHQILKRYGIPGPKPNFFDGNLLHLRSEPHPNNIISSWLKKYGDVCGCYAGNDIYIFIKDLELLKKVLIKDFNLFSNRPLIFIDSPPFPQTLVGLKDKRWKEVRNIVSPTFSSGKIKQMTDIVSKKVDITVGIILKKAEHGEIFNIYSMVQGLTLDVIAACALAMKTECQENPQDRLLLTVRTMLKNQYNKGLEYSLIFPFTKKIFSLLEFATIFGKSTNYIVDHLKSVVNERLQNPEFKSFDILQALLDNISSGNTDESGTKLTEEEVVANAFVVFLAGFETTATALAFTFYLLVKHPEVQNRVYQEIKEAKDSSYATIQSLQYMDQVFSESLRIYPPVTGFTTRICDQDYQVGSYTFPKGVHIVAPVWDLHHDPEL